MELIWNIVNIFLTLGIIAGFVLWFFPRRWIVWSETTGKLLRGGGPPPWVSLNFFGKVVLIIFYGSALMLFLVLIIGVYNERA